MKSLKKKTFFLQKWSGRLDVVLDKPPPTVCVVNGKQGSVSHRLNFAEK
jgi:hypothetical protein